MSQTLTLGSHELDLLALRLKLQHLRVKKRAFLSFGSLADKHRLLPSAQKLQDLGVQIFATTGTSTFLEQYNIPSTRVTKINENREPDVRTYLREGMFDLVVNIWAEGDYDEAADAKIIRSLAYEHRVPIVTDSTFAIEMIDQLARNAELDRQPRRKISMKEHFLGLVFARGGWADNHGHLDKSELMTPELTGLGKMPMQDKWRLYRKLKEDYNPEDLFARMSQGVEFSMAHGVTHLRTMVDADTLVQLKCIEAALAVKEAYQGKIVMEIGIQPLEGVLEPGAWQWVEKACGMADFVGGLPSRDAPQPEKHLDRLMSMAKEMGKRLDVHVDQKGVPWENETKLLALKTIEHGMEDRVSAVHAIISRKPLYEQREIAKLLHSAGVTVQICPRAAIGMEQLDMQVQMSNSIAPMPLFLEEKVNMCAGSDNRIDFFCPYTDGDMWIETCMLMEACRDYTAETLADIMCNKSLFASV